MVPLSGCLQISKRRLLAQLFLDVYWLPLENFQEVLLNDVKMRKPVTKLIVAQGGRARFDCGPMLGIGPFLMCIKITKCFQHDLTVLSGFLIPRTRGCRALSGRRNCGPG